MTFYRGEKVYFESEKGWVVGRIKSIRRRYKNRPTIYVLKVGELFYKVKGESQIQSIPVDDILTGIDFYTEITAKKNIEKAIFKLGTVCDKVNAAMKELERLMDKHGKELIKN